MDNYNDYQNLITRAREYENNESIKQTPAKKKVKLSKAKYV